MSDELVQAVAKAIYTANNETIWNNDADEPYWQMYADDANAAIDAHKQWLEDNGKVIVDKAALERLTKPFWLKVPHAHELCDDTCTHDASQEEGK